MLAKLTEISPIAVGVILEIPILRSVLINLQLGTICSKPKLGWVHPKLG
jgi:hypothetical protein